MGKYNMNVAVLGKGLSLNNFMEIPLVDEYVIVNDIEASIEQNINLKHSLMLKPTTHVPNRNIQSVRGMISNGMYRDLNIKQIVQPYTEEMKCSHGGSCHCRYYSDGYFIPTDDIKIPAKLLDEIHKNFMYKRGELEGHSGSNKYPYHYPSAGIAAIAYATIELKPKNIYLLGYDFHEGGYASGEHMPESYKNESVGAREMISKLIKLYPDIHFHLYTLSDFPYEHKNLIYRKLIRQNKPMVKEKK